MCSSLDWRTRTELFVIYLESIASYITHKEWTRSQTLYRFRFEVLHVWLHSNELRTWLDFFNYSRLHYLGSSRLSWCHDWIMKDEWTFLVQDRVSWALISHGILKIVGHVIKMSHVCVTGWLVAFSMKAMAWLFEKQILLCKFGLEPSVLVFNLIYVKVKLLDIIVTLMNGIVIALYCKLKSLVLS